jgi:hypothetical protein
MTYDKMTGDLIPTSFNLMDTVTLSFRGGQLLSHCKSVLNNNTSKRKAWRPCGSPCLVVCHTLMSSEKINS